MKTSTDSGGRDQKQSQASLETAECSRSAHSRIMHTRPPRERIRRIRQPSHCFRNSLVRESVVRSGAEQRLRRRWAAFQISRRFVVPPASPPAAPIARCSPRNTGADSSARALLCSAVLSLLRSFLRER